MILSELQVLPISDKRKWLQSLEGRAQLQEWILSSISLYKIAYLLNIHDTTLCKWCERDPELFKITGLDSRPPKADHTAPPAYRLIVGLIKNQHFKKIIAEHDTAEAVWHEPYIHQHFSSYGKSEFDYFDGYLKKIASTGYYPLSNNICIAYCTITRAGVVKPIKPPLSLKRV